MSEWPDASLGASSHREQDAFHREASASSYRKGPSMRSTYLSVGGADRERVITETWRLLRERQSRGEIITPADLENACQRICPEWRDDAMSLAASLTARAYGAMEDSLDDVAAKAAGARKIKVEDLDELLSAHAILKEIDRLSRDIAMRRT